MPMLSGVLGRRGPASASGRHEVVPTNEPSGAASDFSGLSPRSYDRDQFFGAHPGHQEEHLAGQSLPGQRGSPNDAAWEELAAFRYAKFTLEGFPGEKHAVFISDRLAVHAETFGCICEALGREPPSMALCGVSSACHPGRMVTPELRTCPAFGGLVEEGRSCLGMAAGGDARGSWGGLGKSLNSLKNLAWGRKGSDYQALGQELTGVEKAENDRLKAKELDDFVDNVFQQRAVSLSASIASAAQSLNAWLLTSPGMTTFETLLQLGPKTSSEVEIVKAVAVHMQDRAYMECPRSKELLSQLFHRSEPMSSTAVDDFAPLGLPGDIWEPAQNGANAEFRRHGFRRWSFSHAGDSAARGHPAVSWPWPCGDIFFLFYREEDGSLGTQADWSFQTERYHDAAAIPFQPEMLAPPAYVVIGGAGPAKKKLLQVMQVVRPTVILDNTPGVAKQMSLLLNLLKQVLRADLSECRHLLRDGAWSGLPAEPLAADLLKAVSPSKILQRVVAGYDYTRMPLDARLTLSDVVYILDLARSRPMVFKESLCVLDPLHDSPEDSTHLLASALGSSHVGSTMEVNRDARLTSSLVLRVWDVHHRLFKAKARLGRSTAYMEVAIAVCTLLAVSFSVVAVHLRLERSRLEEAILASGTLPAESDPVSGVFLYAVRLPALLLPIGVGMVTILQAHLRLSHKWARTHQSLSLVTSEIFTFLGGVGRYSADAETNRDILSGFLEDVIYEMSTLGITADAGGGGGGHRVGGADAASLESEALQQHIEESIYGLQPRGWMCRMLQRAISFVGLSGGDPRREHCSKHMGDFVSMLTAEMYVDVRIATLLEHLRERTKGVQRIHAGTSIAIYALLFLTAGLAMCGITIGVPICITFLVYLASAQKQIAPLDLCEANQAAIEELTRLELRWHSMSIREQREWKTRSTLISRTEKVMLAVASNIGRLPVVLQDEADEDIIEDAGLPSPPASNLAVPLRCSSGTSTPAQSSARGPCRQTSSRRGSAVGT